MSSLNRRSIGHAGQTRFHDAPTVSSQGRASRRPPVVQSSSTKPEAATQAEGRSRRTTAYSAWGRTSSARKRDLLQGSRPEQLAGAAPGAHRRPSCSKQPTSASPPGPMRAAAAAQKAVELFSCAWRPCAATRSRAFDSTSWAPTISALSPRRAAERWVKLSACAHVNRALDGPRARG